MVVGSPMLGSDLVDVQVVWTKS